MFGWIGEAGAASAGEGWAGALCLPREMRLGPDGTLRQRPVAELERLRAAPLGQAEITDDPTVCRDAVELLVEAEPAENVELQVRVSPGVTMPHLFRVDHGELTRVVVSRSSGSLIIDTRFSSDPSRAGAVSGDVTMRRLEIAPDEPLSLRVFVDRSVIEVFVNDRQTAAFRVYPTDPAADGVRLARGPGLGGRLRGWRLTPAIRPASA